ncbi:unnamed protein product, partial [Sphacelaria rigidula]
KRIRYLLLHGGKVERHHSNLPSRIAPTSRRLPVEGFPRRGRGVPQRRRDWGAETVEGVHGGRKGRKKRRRGRRARRRGGSGGELREEKEEAQEEKGQKWR